MIKQVCRNYNKIPSKKSLGFHVIPYHSQYESRDFNTEKVNLNIKNEINRKFFIKEFNPYLRSSVSENLSQSLKDFYSQKYSQR
tara:strand:+ start:133 stop:384 length:252 start_codon:yes stop_codon:yes gene_type:complete